MKKAIIISLAVLILSAIHPIKVNARNYSPLNPEPLTHSFYLRDKIREECIKPIDKKQSDKKIEHKQILVSSKPKVSKAPLEINQKKLVNSLPEIVPKQSHIIDTAKQYLGTKYVWGGISPKEGFDCSGFTSYVYSKNGIHLPRVANDQYHRGISISEKQLQSGDLVFFSMKKQGIDHVGIYLGNGQFINASNDGVSIASLNSYWDSHYVGAKRIM